MKKTIIFLCGLFMAVCASAQFMRTEELEKYAKERYGDKWIDAAASLGGTLSLDKNNSLTYVQVIEAPGKSKESLYLLLNYWYTASFNDANSVIKLNDKELGCIIGEGYMENIAEHSAGLNAYNVSIRPIIKTDIKEGRVRVTYTVQNYDVLRVAGGGLTGRLLSSDPRTMTSYDEKWPLEQCYPFVEKDKHKKTSSKALIMTHAYSNVIIDKIEEAIKHGVVGNEDEDW